MSTRITLCAKSIRAMLHCATKHDIRWYINGVTVDTVNGKAVLLATNRHILASLMTEATFSGTAERIFIPHAAVARIPATASSVTITQRTDQVTLRIDGDERITRESFKRTEKSPVNLISMLTRQQPKRAAPPATVNAAYITTMMKTVIDLQRARGFGRMPPAAQLKAQGGEDALLVTSPLIPEFAGLIMPLRFDETDLPKWIGAYAAEAAQAEKAAKAKAEA